MPRVRKINGGLGAFEGLTLSVWKVPGTDGRRIRARVEGVTDAFCGNGARHDVAVKLTYDEWIPTGPGSFVTSSIVEALVEVHETGCDDAAYEVFCDAVDSVSELWSDPCEDYVLDEDE